MEKTIFGELGMVKSLPFFSLLIMESIPLFWNAIKWSKSPWESKVIILTSSKLMSKAIPSCIPSKTSLLIFFVSTFDGKENKELAVHPPQQHFSNVKITLHMVVNVPQEFERVTFTQRGEIPFLVHFSLSSNYIVSKCLSHEGKATVTQL